MTVTIEQNDEITLNDLHRAAYKRNLTFTALSWIQSKRQDMNQSFNLFIKWWFVLKLRNWNYTSYFPSYLKYAYRYFFSNFFLCCFYSLLKYILGGLILKQLIKLKTFLVTYLVYPDWGMHKEDMQADNKSVILHTNFGSS